MRHFLCLFDCLFYFGISWRTLVFQSQSAKVKIFYMECMIDLTKQQGKMTCTNIVLSTHITLSLRSFFYARRYETRFIVSFLCKKRPSFFIFVEKKKLYFIMAIVLITNFVVSSCHLIWSFFKKQKAILLSSFNCYYTSVYCYTRWSHTNCLSWAFFSCFFYFLQWKGRNFIHFTLFLT